MAKDEFLSVRVNKEFKKHLQQEAKRKGVSLAKYIEQHFEDNFKDTKALIHMLIENAKDERPEYWKTIEVNPILKKLESFAEVFPTDFVNPMGKGNTEPQQHLVFMMAHITYLIADTVNHFDSIDEEYKQDTANKYFWVVEAIAQNLNKFKSSDIETQKYFISKIKDIIELICFNYTSMAFAKDSFLKIKEELDRTEKTLLAEIVGKHKK